MTGYQRDAKAAIVAVPGLLRPAGPHNMASKMRFEIELTSEANDDFRRLDARRRAEVRDAIDVHLRHEPTKLSKSRIKRLRGLARPQYRLRVGDYRVFYDVAADTVTVHGIMAKADAAHWLAVFGLSTTSERGDPDDETGDVGRDHDGPSEVSSDG